MKLSRAWLAEHVPLLDLPTEQLAERMTAAGHAVEGIETVGDDLVLDCDLTTNRPDVMCHRGLAREIAVVLERPLSPLATELVEGSEQAADACSITIDAGDGCAVYHARVIRGVRVGASPAWLAQRLAAIGVRSINNVVDVTNYVLWDLGQPLHAFDLGTIPGGVLRVRHSEPGEILTTLDAVRRELAPGTLVIADRERPIALGGVMGGLDTEVTDATVDVLLEAAFFDPAAVRRTARQTGLHTDASHRYERGSDPRGPSQAIDRAAALIRELAGGEISRGQVEGRGTPLPEAAPIALDAGRLERLVGMPIETGETERILRGLGCTAIAADGGWQVTPPSWRRFDLEEEADLIEEVVRIVGFDRIPSTLPASRGGDAPEGLPHRVRRLARHTLAAAGYLEAIDYAFHDTAADAAFPGLEPGSSAPVLANPLSERLALMRRSLAPGLVAAARFNQRRGAPGLRLFEIGHVFWGGGEADALALCLGGRFGSPWQRTLEADVFDLKGAIELVAAELSAEILAGGDTDQPGLAADCRCELLDGGGRPVGFLGRLAEHEGYDLYVAELRLDRLATELRPAQIDPPPRLPGIDADLTLTHPLSVPWADLAAAIEAAAVPDLAHFALKDRYRGAGVPPDAVNTTIAFRYQAAERSLTQDEINSRHLALGDHLRARFASPGDSP